MREFLAENAGRSGCWIYPAPVDRDGYAFYCERGVPSRAHRVAYQLSVSRVRTRYVCHRCDRPACCNPAHLFAGTARDNYLDSKRKDRHTRGVRVGSAKLSDAKVRKIRLDPRAQVIIAAAYGVSQQIISSVKRRYLWSHVA